MIRQAVNSCPSVQMRTFWMASSRYRTAHQAQEDSPSSEHLGSLQPQFILRSGALRRNEVAQVTYCPRPGYGFACSAKGFACTSCNLSMVLILAICCEQAIVTARRFLMRARPSTKRPNARRLTKIKTNGHVLFLLPLHPFCHLLMHRVPKASRLCSDCRRRKGTGRRRR